MKKDGFTLVELIAVIVILSLILTLSVPSLIGTLKNNKEQALEKINELIILAAKDYVVDYHLTTPRDISLSELCKNYLDCPIINPVTNEEMNISVRVDANKNYTIMNNQLIELKVVLNGGKLSKDISGGYAPNTEIILENPTRENYGFAGWKVVSGDAVIEGSILKLGTENSTIVANWVGTPVKLSVDLDNGIGENKSGEYYSNTTIDLDTPTKENYIFVGWKIVSGDAIVSGNNITFGLEDASVKALWVQETYEFAYTGSEQIFTAPVTGYYKLEVWGAEGGKRTFVAGFGGYSIGEVYLKENEKLYVNVGGVGGVTTGGYNGGGSRVGDSYGNAFGSGGGATHIATATGLLSSLENNKDSILIVAGGGGGSGNGSSLGSGGGYVGNNSDIATGGTQISAGQNSKIDSTLLIASFGRGADSGNEGAGGGGYYGGGAGLHNTIAYRGAGGSGYIGNSRLSNKKMYCYNCQTSNEESTKTISVQCKSINPTEKCSKENNGYARITYVNSNDNTNIYRYDYFNDVETFIAPKTGRYKLEVWGAQGGEGKTSMDYNQKGGYGGYSKGEVYLKENDKLYVVVGEQGKTGIGDGKSRVTVIGGYNGGANNLAGYSYSTDNYFGSGGGATHIATSTGLLSDLENNKDSILIVAGGGGGSYYFLLQSYYHHSVGGSGGGFEGQDVQEYYSSSDTTEGYKATGGKQQVDSGNSYLIYGTFGKANAPTDNGLGGGGGGFYGGASGSGGGGGSGYIGNSLLTNKVMYCYNCTSSSEEATKTISTTCTNKNATENCSKQGNGYAKITYLGE